MIRGVRKVWIIQKTVEVLQREQEASLAFLVVAVVVKVLEGSKYDSRIAIRRMYLETFLDHLIHLHLDHLMMKEVVGGFPL
jgi:hypothetical protein